LALPNRERENLRKEQYLMESMLKAAQKPEAEALLAVLKNADESVIQKWRGYMEGFRDGQHYGKVN